MAFLYPDLLTQFLCLAFHSDWEGFFFALSLSLVVLTAPAAVTQTHTSRAASCPCGMSTLQGRVQGCPASQPCQHPALCKVEAREEGCVRTRSDVTAGVVDRPRDHEYVIQPPQLGVSVSDSRSAWEKRVLMFPRAPSGDMGSLAHPAFWGC